MHQDVSVAAYAADIDAQTYEVRATAWTAFTIEIAIPQGTRTIRYELQGTRFSGGDNDSYFDDMTLGVGFAN